MCIHACMCVCMCVCVSVHKQVRTYSSHACHYTVFHWFQSSLHEVHQHVYISSYISVTNVLARLWSAKYVTLKTYWETSIESHCMCRVNLKDTFNSFRYVCTHAGHTTVTAYKIIHSIKFSIKFLWQLKTAKFIPSTTTTSKC